MKLKKGLVKRKVGDESVVLSTKEAALDFNGMITLEGVGERLWELLETDTSKEKLLETVLGEYDVNKETASKDIDDFLAQLEKLELLE